MVVLVQKYLEPVECGRQDLDSDGDTDIKDDGNEFFVEPDCTLGKLQPSINDKLCLSVQSASDEVHRHVMPVISKFRPPSVVCSRSHVVVYKRCGVAILRCCMYHRSDRERHHIERR